MKIIVREHYDEDSNFTGIDHIAAFNKPSSDLFQRLSEEFDISDEGYESLLNGDGCVCTSYSDKSKATLDIIEINVYGE